MSEPRKASDIILSLEGKVDQLIQFNKSLDFNVKLLFNKLNEVINKINTIETTGIQSAPPPTFTVEAPKTILVSKENQLPIEKSPVGFRRTSRPETFEAKEAPKPQAMPTPTTQPKPAQQSAPMAIEQPVEKVVEAQSNINGSKVSVQQRIVDNTGKSIFLANIEIKDKQTSEVVYKGRTTGVGKYSASLPLGQYIVSIKKSEALDKPKIDVMQNLIVDGAQNPLNLPILIIK